MEKPKTTYENNDFKVVKETHLWQVTLESGRDDYYSIDYLIFEGVNENEVWKRLCIVYEKLWRSDNLKYYRPGLMWKKKMYIVKSSNKNLEDIDWDIVLGDAQAVNIERLEVIYFKNNAVSLNESSLLCSPDAVIDKDKRDDK